MAAAAAPLVERFVVGVDVESYSGRNTRQQHLIRHALADLLRDATEAAGLDRDQWHSLGGGDGELAVLPPDVDMVPVVDGLVRELNRRLLVRNEDHAPDLQIRLRVAMHIDALMPSLEGYAGPALVVLARLLDSTPVRVALQRARPAAAALALVVSEPVYRMVVMSGLGDLRPKDFLPVQVDIPTKRFSEVAYLHVPHHDMGTFPIDGEHPQDGQPPQDGSPANGGGPRPGGPRAATPPPPGGTFDFTAGRDVSAGDVWVGTKHTGDAGDR